MEVEKIVSAGLDCMCCRYPGSENIAYLLYPMDMPQELIVEAASRYGVSIAVIRGMDWDDDLTPWPAPGVPEGSPDFKGNAAVFYDRLTSVVIPDIENKIGVEHPVRTLIGVSLSGLFTLWQWARSDFFLNIATLSGSFWYQDFVEWVWRMSFAGKSGRCYMLLGRDEPRAGNRVFATVGKCTDEIVGYLRRQGVDVTLHIVRGNHYQYARERFDMAMSAIFG